MKSPQHLLLPVLLFVGLSPGIGRAEPEWAVQFEPMYMGLVGSDEDISNVGLQKFSPGGGFSSESVAKMESNLDDTATLRFQIEYRGGPVNLGFSAWRFDDNADSQLRFSHDVTPFTHTLLYYHSNGINDQVFSVNVPPGNVRQSVEARATDELSMWNADLYANWDVRDVANLRWTISAGAKFADIEMERLELASLSVRNTLPDNFRRFRTDARSAADSDFLAGPMLGVQVDWSHGHHRFVGMFRQSVLFGEVDRRIDTTTSYLVFDPNVPQPPLTPQLHISDSESEVIPVSELKVNWLYQVSKRLALGVGAFASIQVNAPGLPQRRADRQDEDTLIFLGGMGTVDYRF